ncbi:MAG: VanZ family protein [Cellvibrionaceae bacterium]
MTSAILMAAQRFGSRSSFEVLLLLAIVAGLPFFFIDGPNWLPTDAGRALANLGHIPFFALVTLLMHRRFPLHNALRWATASGLILVISAIIELIQLQVGRSASAHDVLRNLTGAWLVIFWLQTSRPLVWSGRVVATSLLTVELFLLTSALVTQHQLSRQLPVIANLENPGEMQRWSSVNSDLVRNGEMASEGEFALQCRLSPAAYSGLSLDQLPHDWSNYRELAFDLYSSQAHNFQMTLRIHDAAHELGNYRWQYGDRLNQRIDVKPGWNRYRVALSTIENAPRNRKMDLTTIRNLMLFATRLDEPKTIYVDNFRLEK